MGVNNWRITPEIEQTNKKRSGMSTKSHNVSKNTQLKLQVQPSTQSLHQSEQMAIKGSK